VAKLVRNERLVYLGLAVLAGVAGYRSGSDSNFDLYNYHAYIGKAALSGRWSSDVAPAGLGSFNNPLADLPVAILLNSSVQALSIGLIGLQFLCWAGAWFFINEIGRTRPIGERLLALGIALSGSGAISVAFTTFQDWTVAACLLVMLTLSLRALRDTRRRWPVMSGFFGALAIAVKLTAAPFVLALCLSVLLYNRRQIWRIVIGTFAGFAMLILPWWVRVGLRFGNPVFPFYNGVFRSSSGGVASFDDTRFGATSWQDFGRLPMDMLRGTLRYSELLYRDWRWVAVLPVAALYAALGRSTEEERLDWRFVTLFAGSAYLLWFIQFGIYRYALVLEIVVAVFIGLTLPRCFPRLHTSWFAVGVLVLASFQIIPSWGRNGPLRVTVPLLKQDSVLLADLGPSSYLVNSIPRSTRLASTQGFAFGFFKQDGELWDELQQFVTDSVSGKGLLIVTNPDQPIDPTVSRLGIQPDLSTCQTFAGAFNKLAICRAVRLSVPASEAPTP
jgi:hypothetical protein